ncbi:MAG: rod shape-determining protein MreC [Cycloclasticus pugetii]|uniref:Cell shape-determining protein MreC n=1 Tax=Cycloclasticus pugetii TaxID=34068 RepID=A0AB33Z0V8_9GAMM|nr:rod shape-determining protein MreC [Cycloclasticus sp. PY97N]EPD12856.1 Cell wall structural complex MreBCD transmembrane component MreC [Cycloclasticus pugetii]SHI56467.1 rod shape-determining protein MreC [Cycloclasticus pugetii]
MLLLLAQQTNQLTRLKDSLSFIVHPVLIVVDLPSQLYAWLTESTTELSELADENQRLKDELLFLKVKLQKFEALETENTRLHSLLESSFKIGEQFISASLIKVNQHPNTTNIVIDKGSRFDLYKGQAALNEDGVLGQITNVHPLTSSIILITDPNHAIPVEINRTGLRTIASGSGLKNTLTLPYLPHNADIKIGDLLTTSGLGGVFPSGYPVATVTKLAPLPGEAFMHAEAKTVAKIDSTRDILLVWSQQQPIPILSGVPEEPEVPTDNAR